MSGQAVKAKPFGFAPRSLDRLAFLMPRSYRGNGIAERFVRTLKENLLWVRRFQTVEELRLGLLAFKDIYNRQWRIGRHGYRSPEQVMERQKREVVKVA